MDSWSATPLTLRRAYPGGAPSDRTDAQGGAGGWRTGSGDPRTWQAYPLSRRWLAANLVAELAAETHEALARASRIASAAAR
jgi:hypothetical protein